MCATLGTHKDSGQTCGAHRVNCARRVSIRCIALAGTSVGLVFRYSVLRPSTFRSRLLVSGAGDQSAASTPPAGGSVTDGRRARGVIKEPDAGYGLPQLACQSFCATEAALNAGKSKAASAPMTAMTSSSSTSVNAGRGRFDFMSEPGAKGSGAALVKHLNWLPGRAGRAGGAESCHWAERPCRAASFPRRSNPCCTCS